MTDNPDSSGGIIEELTPEEQKALAKALKRLESDIFSRVIKRLSVFMGVVLSILLLGGLVNFSSCSSNVENNASQKLASDPELRDKVVTKAQGSFKDLQDKLKALTEEAAAGERRNALAATTFVDDLAQIRLMVERINQELSGRLPSGKDGSNAPPKEKR